MEIDEIKKLLSTPPYHDLKDHKNLGSNLIIVALGGSYAYGMNREDSDIDIRGVAINSAKEIVLGNDFKKYCNSDLDITIYSFNRIIELLTYNNPNTIEILGCIPEHYLYLSDVGKALIENRKMFLSQICIHTFAGYASGQLHRLENKAARLVGQAQNEEYILKSINNAQYEFKNRYFPYENSAIKLYTDKSERDDFESEIYMDINLSHYPLRDWAGMWNEMKAIVSSYNKLGKRNEKAISKDKLGKHMAHLLRLYMMCIDILELGDIFTYRVKEHDLLMDIRNGAYLDDNRQPIAAFYDLLNEYEQKFEYAKNNTCLPEIPDKKRIEEFKADINTKIVRGDI